MSERFKEPVLKTGDGATHREFESHTLRQKPTDSDRNLSVSTKSTLVSEMLLHNVKFSLCSSEIAAAMGGFNLRFAVVHYFTAASPPIYFRTTFSEFAGNPGFWTIVGFSIKKESCKYLICPDLTVKEMHNDNKKAMLDRNGNGVVRGADNVFASPCI